MSEDRFAQAKSLLTYVETDKGRIPYFVSDPDEWHPRLLVGLFDDLISEVERLRGSCDKATVDLMSMGTTIATLREALERSCSCGLRSKCVACKALATAQKE